MFYFDPVQTSENESETNEQNLLFSGKTRTEHECRIRVKNES